jgi:hypothetical protein
LSEKEIKHKSHWKEGKETKNAVSNMTTKELASREDTTKNNQLYINFRPLYTTGFLM